ncbi:MAG: hypothetical protein IJT70_01620 [Clostridia bacterium]|nr:hypothetical protein [Clostridia bacterium]
MKRSTKTQIICASVLAVVSVAAMYFFSRNIKFGVGGIELPKDTEIQYISVDSSKDTTPADTGTETVETTPPEDSPEAKWVLKETDYAPSDYIEKTVFLGDRTIGKMNEKFIPEIPHLAQQVWSCAENISITHAGSTDSFLYPKKNQYMSFVSALKDRKPQYLILTFGSYCEEDISQEQFEGAYSVFIRDIKDVSANTKVIVQSILPVGRNCSIVTADAIKERNAWLLDVCETNSVYYLDTWSELIDADGYLSTQYYDPDNMLEEYDGYFMNDIGYRKMVQYIRTHAHPAYAPGEESE